MHNYMNYSVFYDALWCFQTFLWLVYYSVLLYCFPLTPYRDPFPISLIGSLIPCYSLFYCPPNFLILAMALFYFPVFCSYSRLCTHI